MAQLNRRSLYDMYKNVHAHATKFCESPEELQDDASFKKSMKSNGYISILCGAPKSGWEKRGTVTRQLNQNQPGEPLGLKKVLYVIPACSDDPIYKSAPEYKTAFGSVNHTLFKFIQTGSTSTYADRMITPSVANDYEQIKPLPFHIDIMTMPRTPQSIRILTTEEYYKNWAYDKKNQKNMNLTNATLVMLDARVDDMIQVTQLRDNVEIISVYIVTSSDEVKIKSEKVNGKVGNEDSSDDDDDDDESSDEEEDDE